METATIPAAAGALAHALHGQLRSRMGEVVRFKYLESFGPSFEREKPRAPLEETLPAIGFTVTNAGTFRDGWGARKGTCVAGSRWKAMSAFADLVVA